MIFRKFINEDYLICFKNFKYVIYFCFIIFFDIWIFKVVVRVMEMFIDLLIYLGRRYLYLLIISFFLGIKYRKMFKIWFMFLIIYYLLRAL